MQELKVEKVIIGKQTEENEQYERFKNIITQKRIKIGVVKKGDKLQIEKDLYFDILWPNSENLLKEESLNNNSLVCNFHYKNFSMLFTGDIEEAAEKQILNDYKGKENLLNADILKVPHHASRTSSTKEFLKDVNPKCALIGVGKNNIFGHPNSEVITRLENMRSKDIQNRFEWRNLYKGI